MGAPPSTWKEGSWSFQSLLRLLVKGCLEFILESKVQTKVIPKPESESRKGPQGNSASESPWRRYGFAADLSGVFDMVVLALEAGSS